jgi:hypothetical protein
VIDLSHLDAIDLRLSHERARLGAAKNDKERAWYEHSVRMIEREREAEITFLAKHGIAIEPAPTLDQIMTDEELFGALHSSDKAEGGES